MICSEIIKKLEEQSPVKYALGFDNVGLLIGRRMRDVKKVLIALDANDEVVKKAIELNIDMLITHHPMLFNPIKRINEDDIIGRRILDLVENNISYYAMHTNFDVCGMADYIADKIDLRNKEILDITYDKDNEEKQGIGRVGNLDKEISLKECAELIKQKFNLENVLVFGNLDNKIKRIAISGGSGESMISKAIKLEADVLISGDIRHHQGLDGIDMGINIIDASHQGLEKIFIEFINDYLNKNFENELEIIMYDIGRPYKVI